MLLYVDFSFWVVIIRFPIFYTLNKDKNNETENLKQIRQQQQKHTQNSTKTKRLNFDGAKIGEKIRSFIYMKTGNTL